MNQLGLEKSMMPPPTNTISASGGLATHTSMQKIEKAVTCASCFIFTSMGALARSVKLGWEGPCRTS